MANAPEQRSVIDPAAAAAADLAVAEAAEAAAEEAAALFAANEQLTQNLDEARDERDRYLDQLQRTTAEYTNYRRRTEQEREKQRLSANERLLREMIPVLDDLQRGLAAIPADEQDSKLAEGVRLVEQKFLNALRSNGVSPIEALGQRFDPAVHEAVELDPAGGDTVVAVYAPGYRLGDGVLKPAMVKVGPASTGNA